VLITAGGTREPIDPIRFIGNRSTGKQGYAFAQAALDRGAEVTILSANVALPIPIGAKVIAVETTAELGDALNAEFDSTDILVMAAAVADARPFQVATSKLKKDAYREISLIENSDLVSGVSKGKTNQIIIGFAAESSLNTEEATRKMKAKGLDLIYLNDVSTGEIFGSELTKGIIFTSGGEAIEVGEITKATLANQLLDLASAALN
jgi:phosphopantothenoylcysteine decarboxylase/phosphopantothenate--cysteine ligase